MRKDSVKLGKVKNVLYSDTDVISHCRLTGTIFEHLMDDSAIVFMLTLKGRACRQ